MTEEFQESDLVFPEKPAGNGKEIRCPKVGKKKSDKKKQKKVSVPMSIPEEFSGSSWIRQYLEAHSKDDDDGKGEERVPPHVVVDRRVAGKAAFSLCSGNGRTLKGRDLSEVRDSILRMTGFLES
ncbi:uncharacterized protein LOC112523452 [Cynara cardunculus var. scolymus]|uniref:Senescence regulator n=1 Tax=Cynara cardunculus var. scolymus TaxID=59895 RepID=A0A118JX66_CYNCS|nr:uncharacterized protein LOC112523452 [Cynara cardunculus var. scolymus]KVH97087.1 Senescence regulator [Cynara cardunculus var. scolymus]